MSSEVQKKSTPNKSNIKYYLLIIGIIIGVIMFIVPPPAGVNPAGWKVLALLIPIIMIWATEAIPVGVASMFFLALVVGFHLVKADVAFKGFTNHLAWLMMGAFAIGAAMQKTGLSKRMTYFLLSRLNSFWGLVIAAYAANVCLMAVPSSSARSGILAPVLNAIMDTMDRPVESKFSRLLTYNFCTSTNAFVGTMFLTGGAGNAVMLALYSELTGKTLSWGNWFLIMVIPSLIFAAVSIFGSLMVTGAPEKEYLEKIKNSQATKEAYAALGKMSADEWKVLVMFILAIVLWVLGDRLKLDPGFASLIVMGLLFLPKVGVLPRKALREINWDIVLLIGAVVGVAGILDATGMIKLMSNVLIGPILNPLSHWSLIGIAIGCVIVSLVAHFLLPAPNNLTLAVPLLITWGYKTMHMDIAVVLAFLGLLSVLGDKLIMFPYQMPPYYIYLAMDVTDGPKFSGLLIKMYPILAVAMVVGAFVAYGIIKATGMGI